MSLPVNQTIERSGVWLKDATEASGFVWNGIKIRTSGVSGTVTMNTDTTRNGVYLIEEVR